MRHTGCGVRRSSSGWQRRLKKWAPIYDKELQLRRRSNPAGGKGFGNLLLGVGRVKSLNRHAGGSSPRCHFAIRRALSAGPGGRSGQEMTAGTGARQDDAGVLR